jgi:hypothetical protein
MSRNIFCCHVVYGDVVLDGNILMNLRYTCFLLEYLKHFSYLLIYEFLELQGAETEEYEQEKGFISTDHQKSESKLHRRLLSSGQRHLDILIHCDTFMLIYHASLFDILLYIIFTKRSAQENRPMGMCFRSDRDLNVHRSDYMIFFGALRQDGSYDFVC